MKRLLYCFSSVACWLSIWLACTQQIAVATEGIWGGGEAGSCCTSGSDIWARVNPDFCGFPTASIATDIVVLGRSAPAAQPILFDSLGATLLDASELRAADAGFRFNLTFFDQCDWDFMFDALLMGEMYSRQSVDPSNGVDLFFYQGVAVDPVDQATFRSDLDTCEFNARYRLSPYFALLGGARYLELSEDLDFNEAGSPGGYRSQSDNRLIGAQAGAEGVLPLNGFGRLFAVGKYGVYNNRFEVAAQAMSGGAPLTIRVHDDMFATVGEFNAGWEVQTVPCMTLRFGYQALWMTNMALSTDQLNQYSIFDSSGSVRKGHPVYHGGFVGMVFTF